MIVAFLLGLAMAPAAPEPVVWTSMADPDPHFVEPKPIRAKRVPVSRSVEPIPNAGAQDDSVDRPVRDAGHYGERLEKLLRDAEEIEAAQERKFKNVRRPKPVQGSSRKWVSSPESDAVTREYEAEARRIEEMGDRLDRIVADIPRS